MYNIIQIISNYLKICFPEIFSNLFEIVFRDMCQELEMFWIISIQLCSVFLFSDEIKYEDIIMVCF